LSAPAQLNADTYTGLEKSSLKYNKLVAVYMSDSSSSSSPLKALAIPKSAAAAKKDLEKCIRLFGDCGDFGLLELLRF